MQLKFYIPLDIIKKVLEEQTTNSRGKNFSTSEIYSHLLKNYKNFFTTFIENVASELDFKRYTCLVSYFEQKSCVKKYQNCYFQLYCAIIEPIKVKFPLLLLN